MFRDGTRRQFLAATTAILGGLGIASTTTADDHRSYVLEQDGDCYPVVPLSGEDPVEAFYEWDLAGRSYSSEGTRELQESETSLLFLYRGPEGLSLVVVHDAADDGTPGGTVSFELQGVPADATWAVKDDLYDASTNVDTWEINGTELDATDENVTDDYNESSETDTDPVENETAGNETDGDANVTDAGDVGTDFDANVTDAGDVGTDSDSNETDSDDNETADTTRTDEIDWWWTTGRTDGGALRGLAVEDLELRVEPAFNDASELADKTNEGEVTSWELLSGNRDDPDRTELDLAEPLTLRTGSCGDDASMPTATAGNGNSTSADIEDDEGTSNATDVEDEASDEDDEESE